MLPFSAGTKRTSLCNSRCELWILIDNAFTKYLFRLRNGFVCWATHLALRGQVNTRGGGENAKQISEVM